MAEEISLARMVQAGVIPMDTSSAIAEIQQRIANDHGLVALRF